MIPFSPPFIDQDVINEVNETLLSGWITSGPKVKALEEEVVKLTGCQAAVCVNSWTSGAMMMLKWFDIKAGDEVIMPAYTYSATALSVLNCGATPVMVDILDDFTIDPEKIKAAITSRTKAIIPVDIAGWPCQYDQIMDLVSNEEIKRMFIPESNNQEKLGRILIIADAAHSIGAIYKGQPATKAADIAIFSFHAVKNVTTAEGGCVCLNLPENFNPADEYSYLRLYTLNGQSKDAFTKSKAGGWKYDILFQGMKINLPDICAAIGLAQIRKYSEQLLKSRKDIALQFCKGFAGYEWFVPPPLEDHLRESSYHLFPLRVRSLSEQQRDSVIDELTAKGISVNVHFIPMPMFTLFKSLGFKIEDYPVAYQQFSTEISLPIYPQLRDEDIRFIIKEVIDAVKRVMQRD